MFSLDKWNVRLYSEGLKGRWIHHPFPLVSSAGPLLGSPFWAEARRWGMLKGVSA